MGSAIASYLISRGYQVHGFNRTPERARALAAKGAIIHQSPRDLAAAVQILITSLTDENAVEALAFGSDGFLAALSKDSLWIEMSTIDPDASIAFERRASELGLKKLDVPIVGPPEMVIQGKAMLLVGGDETVFDAYKT